MGCWAGVGVPDGLKVHPGTGCVFAGTGSGVSVYDEAGELCGEIVVEGGVANHVFAGDNVLVLLHETEIIKVEFDGRRVGKPTVSCRLRDR